MELEMHSINNIRMMEVIDINSGAKMGYIKDIKIDCEAHKIVSILIPFQRNAWFSKLDIIEVPWEKVRKIGVDVILVEAENYLKNEE